MDSTLGKRIVQNRKRLGMTQDQLADKLGVTAQAVSKWENDQSCPDIAMLPRLAQIFETTTDALLGTPVPPGCQDDQPASDENEDPANGLSTKNGKWEFHYDGGRKGTIGLAILVLLSGILLLLSNLFEWQVGFWDILWPSALLVFGVTGLYPHFSFFRLGCGLLGIWFLICNLNLLSFTLLDGVLFPALVILFGLSLLADAMRKSGSSSVRFKHSTKQSNNYEVDGEHFDYSASFGESNQCISMPRLSHGSISTSFGDYTVDLSGIDELSDACQLEVSCSFGELRILVPRYYSVRQTNSTAFASFEVSGHPDPQPRGTLYMKANVNFGEVSVEYI